MGSRPDIVFIYKVEGKNCPVTIAGEPTKIDVSAVLHEQRRDSPEVREDLVRKIAESVGAEGLDPRLLKFHLGGFVPKQFADDDTINAFTSQSTARARVTLRFDISHLGENELDPLFDFEVALEEHLKATDAGSVDGNDVGMGEYRIYCIGKHRDSLASKVESFAKQSAPLPFEVE